MPGAEGGEKREGIERRGWGRKEEKTNEQYTGSENCNWEGGGGIWQIDS